ncbi:LOW QUALITY PROTEIN: phylloplanin [Citrus clementina]|uniref:LOW QUALITY PROTEIN: phylloplanin n=1 Tax=Citrus clementina TaxID=85681 RepID=UPI000CED1073|nr:LOW QUALITY PROTEIN: phylloplanin [Citrus x clementina]
MLATVTAPIAEAQFGLIGGILGLIRIQGTVFCTANGNMGVNGTATPAFPNALVQLQWNGKVVSSATTNASEIFSIVLDPLQLVLSSLLTNCSLVVNTPLASCNAKPPAAGGLVSSLQFNANTIPAGFQFIP